MEWLTEKITARLNPGTPEVGMSEHSFSRYYVGPTGVTPVLAVERPRVEARDACSQIHA